MSAKAAFILPSSLPLDLNRKALRNRIDVHLVELGTRGDDLLDAELAQLRLELTKLLGELVLVLRP